MKGKKKLHKLLSLLLCCIMVLGMLPSTVFAAYEDGAECANCGHWHYDDWMCECGLCSEDCSNSDCWYETHCKNCGACYMSADNWCDKCGWCQDCMDNEAHCADCGRCFVGESKEELCEECLRCADCVDNGVCDYCNKCDACADTDHCVECHAHVLSGCCVKCGKCYECADGFICATCEHCESCAAEEGLHCEFCGGCLEDIDPCPAHEYDSHCKYCVDYCEGCGQCSYDGDIDGLCADCGFCYECCAENSVAHGCSTGDVCVESSDWDEHLCPGCGECFCDKERCDDCGFCEECCAENSMDAGCSTGEVCTESSEWDEHFCANCGGCFCDYEQCSDCGLCADCCAANAFEKGCDCGDVCVDSSEWEDHKKEYHGEGGVSDDHTHKFKTEWNADQTRHWHECRFCNEKSGEAEHRLTAAGKCEICGYDTSSPLFFVSQPQDLTRKVSDANPYGDDDPNSPINNKATFSVTAVNLAGNELSFQWYEVHTEKSSGKEKTIKLEDVDGETSGSTKSRLSVPVWSDGCNYSHSYYCVVTSTGADGEEFTIESRHAQLRTVHNYGEMKAVDNDDSTPGGGSSRRITYTDVESGIEKTEIYYKGNRYHNRWCVGDDCGRTQYPEKTWHNMVFDKYLGSGKLFNDERETLYFYRWVCTECGYQDLYWYAAKQDIPYSISFVDTPGAYIMDEDDNEDVLTAMAGAELWAHAPYVNKSGYVFDHWEVKTGPDGFTDDSIENDYDTGRFFMPEGSITLRGVYSTDKKPVYEVQIEGVDHEIDATGVITVRAGETFTVKANVLPDNAADKQTYWFAGTDPLDPVIQFSEKDSKDTHGTMSKDIEGAVTLTARKPGTVLLRALSVESRETTSNTPIQDSVIIRVIPAETIPQTHHYKETTVFATCIKKGYTLYECTDEGCTEKYLNNLVDPTGHNDSDGDGLCDNVDQNTGKVCGYKMGGENTSMVGLTKIKKVELTIAAPVRGNSPATTATPAGDEKDCYSVANVTWDPDTKTFVGGTKYSVLLKLEAKDEYGFKLDGIEVANTQFYINGNKATVVSKGAQEVSITYEFPATEDASTTEYIITVTNGKATDGAGTLVSKAAQGITITLTADAAPSGKVFDKWVVESGSITFADASSATTDFTMPASTVSVKATYKDAPVATYVLTTKVNGGHGTVSASKTGLTAGSTETVIFTPDSGYEIDIVTVNGVVTPVLSNVLDVTMDSDKNVIVTYKAIGSSGHSHSYGSEWKNDATNHWYECSCGYKDDVVAHSFKWVVDKEATETQKGSKHEECTVCGYKKAAVDISAIGSITKPTEPSQTNTNTGANSPKTGDDSNMILWIVLLVASGLGITGTVVYSKRKIRKITK